jgi:hypothetical protein
MRRTISFDCSIIAGGSVALESSLDDLLLHGRVPFKPAHGDVIHVKHRQLRERWKARLHADDRLLRVNSHSEMVERDLADIAPDACGIIGVVCQRVCVSEQQELAMIASGRPPFGDDRPGLSNPDARSTAAHIHPG